MNDLKVYFAVNLFQFSTLYEKYRKVWWCEVLFYDY